MKNKLFSLVLLLCLFSAVALGQTASKQLSGTVVAVHDGDTLTVQDENGNQYKIRLAGIDAPELRQEYGVKSQRNLSRFVFGQFLTVFYKKTDKYGRIVGKVVLNGVDVNLKQVTDGCAWHYKEYQSEQSETDRKLYADAETTARFNSHGLWNDTALAPWEWRAAKSSGGSESPTPASPRLRQALESNEQEITYSDYGGGTSGNSSTGGGTVQVRGYTRKDGTVVAPHTRSAPSRKH